MCTGVRVTPLFQWLSCRTEDVLCEGLIKHDLTDIIQENTQVHNVVSV